MDPLTAPPWRIRAIHDGPPRSDGRYVLYWMIGARRSTWNFALDRALAWADALRQPLLVLEALRCDYKWASDRLHQFVIDGMRANAKAFAAARVGYFPYLEPSSGHGRGLLQALAEPASVVVTDRTPVFDLVHLVQAAAAHVPTRFEEVDGYGVVPLDAPSSVFPTAYAFRRYLQRSLRDFLPTAPKPTLDTSRDRRLASPLPDAIVARWPVADLDGVGPSLSTFAIDHGVAAVAVTGGAEHARRVVDEFVTTRLPRFDERSHPDADVSSGLSPFLHFGHVSPHEVLARVLESESWSFERLAKTASGRKEGWWGISATAEEFLDQLITWRELGGNASRRDDYARFESIPEWARSTLARHANDHRTHLYSLDEFASASTHDEVWNAAQRELRTDGRLHNYMRMLWGKKILEWTRSPHEAFDVMVELNNRYALDGRDPNSYSGILWVLGRYDRPWGPERPIFGTVRYMTSDSAVRKLKLKSYLARYGPSRLF